MRRWIAVLALIAAALCSDVVSGQPSVERSDVGDGQGYAEAQDYQEQWRIPVRYAAGLALDPRGDPWLLVSKPPGLIRMDSSGQTAQHIELRLPNGRPDSYLDHRELAILGDASFLVADMRFAPDGSYLGRYEEGGYVFSLGLDLQLYATRFNRVRRLNLADGHIEFEFGELGVAPDRLLSPGRVASDGRRLLVVDAGALKVFDAQGTFQFALNGLLRRLPANHVRSWTRTGLTLDDRGLLYVAVAEHGQVVVLDTAYRPLARVQVRLPMRVAALAGGPLYVLMGAGRSAGLAMFRRPPNALPLTPGQPLARQTEEPTELTLAPPTRLVTPWRRGRPADMAGGDEARVADSVVDPDDPEVRWLASAGGLVRTAPGGQRRVWTAANGLPGNAVRSLWVDERTRYLWIATSAGLARLALDDVDAGLETVGTGEPRATSACGFVGPGSTAGSVLFWNDKGLYELRAEDSEALRYQFPEAPRGVLRMADADQLLVHDGLRLWRFEVPARRLELVLTVDALNDARSSGPSGLPQLTELAWLGDGVLGIETFRHGGFRYDFRSATASERKSAD